MEATRGAQAVEQEADWDRLWSEQDDTGDELDAERGGLRWRTQRNLVEQRFGSFDGLEVIEVGAGRSTNALLYALHGARATVLDRSGVALEQSRARFAGHGLEGRTVEADLFDL